MPAPNPIKTCPGCNDAVVRATLPAERQCSRCRKKERNRLWREANPGAMAANAKRWRDAGNVSARPEGYAEKHRAHESARYHNDPVANARIKAAAHARRQATDPEILNAKARAWRAANPGKSRQYYLQHRANLGLEGRQAQGRAHRERYREERQAGQAAYYARRYGGSGVISNEHLYALHKWQDHCCFYCRESLAGADTIEHVVPLSRGGSNNPWNVTLACGTCNNEKNNRLYAMEWRPSAVMAPPRYHSLHGLAQLKLRLTAEHIDYVEQDDHVLIGERPAFILSSFWLGWAGDTIITALKSRYPSAILFFDKEFARRPDAVINVLKAKAGISERRGARQLMLETPTPQDAQAFIGRWHAMGATGGTIYLGLRDANEWWAMAAFRKDVDHYEVARMAIRETVAGGVSRIIEHFRKDMPEKLPIMAFTDQRMGDGKSHGFAGFSEAGMTERSFFYATPEADGFHARRDFQKQVLENKAEYFDPRQTQVMLARANGLMRVEGLPRLRFVLPVDKEADGLGA
jgi:5-methylcytosine-specific restriction endonuclease McrA